MEKMKKTALTLLPACLGGVIAVGAYKVFENKSDFSIEEKQKQQVQFASLNEGKATYGSAGDVDFTVAASRVTPAVVHIKTTYSATSAHGQEVLLMICLMISLGGVESNVNVGLKRHLVQA